MHVRVFIKYAVSAGRSVRFLLRKKRRLHAPGNRLNCIAARKDERSRGKHTSYLTQNLVSQWVISRVMVKIIKTLSMN